MGVGGLEVGGIELGDRERGEVGQLLEGEPELTELRCEVRVASTDVQRPEEASL